MSALAAGGLAFAALGPRGAKERTDGRLVLDYWEKWTQHEGDAMRVVVDEFNKSQDRLFVRYLVTAGIDQKTLIAVAGGNPPDVVGLWNYNVPLYAETGAIVPMDQFGSRYNVSPERYAPGFRPIVLHPDASGKARMWAAISTGGTVCMYYNRAMLRDAGIDRPPRTISELDAAARKLDVIGGDGTISRAGFMASEPGWWSWIWNYHFGGTLYDQAADRSMVSCEANARAYGWIMEQSGRLGVEAVRKFKSGFATEYSSPKNALLDGKCAMIVQGPWLANVIGKHAPGLDYGVAPFPVADELYREDEPIGLVDSDILVIPAGSRDPEASMEFIAYTQRREVVEYLSTRHFKNSILADVSEGFIREHPNRGVAVHNAVARSPRAFLAPRTRKWPEIKDGVDALFQRLWGHEAPLEKELAKVDRHMQDVLDHTAEQRRRRAGGAA